MIKSASFIESVRNATRFGALGLIVLGLAACGSGFETKAVKKVPGGIGAQAAGGAPTSPAASQNLTLSKVERVDLSDYTGEGAMLRLQITDSTRTVNLDTYHTEGALEYYTKSSTNGIEYHANTICLDAVCSQSAAVIAKVEGSTVAQNSYLISATGSQAQIVYSKTATSFDDASQALAALSAEYKSGRK